MSNPIRDEMIADAHAEIRSMAAALAAREFGPERNRKMGEQQTDVEPAMWKKLADLGFLGMLVPESLGGVGLGFGAAAAVAEELGGALLREPFCAVAVLSAQILIASDNDDLRRDLLRQLCAGDGIPAVAWQEDAAGYAAERISTRFEPGAEGGTLSGRKDFVVGGREATGFIVSARSDEGIGLYWVPVTSPGLAIAPYRTAGGETRAAVSFDAVPVGKAATLVSPPAGLATLQHALDTTAIIVSAELHGVASKLLEVTLAFVRQRKQFGRPIGSFQSVQHRAADHYMYLKITRTAIAAAIAALETGDKDRLGALASRVKARSSDTATRIAKDAVQLHGAMGFTEESDVSLYLNRILLLSSWLGGSAVHRRRYARLHAQAEGTTP